MLRVRQRDSVSSAANGFTGPRGISGANGRASDSFMTFCTLICI